MSPWDNWIRSGLFWLRVGGGRVWQCCRLWQPVQSADPQTRMGCDTVRLPGPIANPGTDPHPWINSARPRLANHPLGQPVSGDSKTTLDQPRGAGCHIPGPTRTQGRPHTPGSTQPKNYQFLHPPSPREGVMPLAPPQPGDSTMLLLPPSPMEGATPLGPPQPEDYQFLHPPSPREGTTPLDPPRKHLLDEAVCLGG